MYPAAIDRRRDDDRLDRIEKRLDKLEERLLDKLEELWQNGLAALGERVAAQEARCAALHPGGAVVQSGAVVVADPDPKRRELPRWAYLLIGGALMAGGKGLEKLVEALAKVIGP